MKLAIRTAFCSNSRFRLGAVLIKKKRVISFGINDMRRSHPKQQKYSTKKWAIGSHAELKCCIGVDLKDLQKSTMYVARILKNGNPALAKPCQCCQSILREFGVRKVFYTITESRVGTLNIPTAV